MNKYNGCWIVIFLWASLQIPALAEETGVDSPPEKTIFIFGDAYDIKTKQLLYREEHTINETSHHVTYKNSEGVIFAEKSLSYQLSYTTPVYSLSDKRFSRETGSVFRDDAWFVYRLEQSGQRDELKLENKQGLVIDAGFNNFVRANFDVLSSGESLKFQFGITDPLIELPMKLQNMPCAKQYPHYDDEHFLCLHAKTISLLYRWFVPDIEVVYSRDLHYLTQYDGPSNLLGDDDKGQTVHIDYRYQSYSPKQAE